MASATADPNRQQQGRQHPREFDDAPFPQSREVAQRAQRSDPFADQLRLKGQHKGQHKETGGGDAQWVRPLHRYDPARDPADQRRRRGNEELPERPEVHASNVRRPLYPTPALSSLPLPVKNPAFSLNDTAPPGQQNLQDDDPGMTPSGGGHRQYQKKDEQSNASESTVDLEMVELRNPQKTKEEPSASRGGHRVYQKYQKGPSNDSVPRRFSSHQGVRASAYSSISVKSWSEVGTELSVVNQDLNKHFKPLFDKHGSEGVSIKMLQEELYSRRSQHLLGKESILDALRAADKDGDDYLSYQDFVLMVKRDLNTERKLAFRGMLLSAVSHVGILPKELRDNFLANYQLCPPPLFIPIITLIQIIIFAVYVADLQQRGTEVTANSGYPSYSPLHYVANKRWQAWRFLTYMFIHNGYLHIIFNVVAQLLFGIPLEIVHGWWRTAIIYLTGVTAGSLAHSVVDSKVGLVGASGGVYAILGAHLAAVVTNWTEMNYKLCDQEEFDSKPCCAVSRIMTSAPARMLVVVVLVVPDTALAIVRRAAFNEDLQVGITAHVGGFLTGLFLGIRVLKNINVHAWEGYLGIVTVIIFLLVCAFAIFFNALYKARYPDTNWSLP